jgi:hypothetical protein
MDFDEIDEIRDSEVDVAEPVLVFAEILSDSATRPLMGRIHH